MFYYVSGKLVLLEPDCCAVDAGGVAYKMGITRRSYDFLSGKEGENVTLYTHMSVKDDAIDLYGFASTEELEAFRLLITVSGIGPKTAGAVLSVLTPEKLSAAVCSEDKKEMSRVPGIGPKTAARIILELKDKMPAVFPASESFSESAFGSSEKSKEAVEALTTLGYTRSESLAMLRGIDVKNLPLEDILRIALKNGAKI